VAEDEESQFLYRDGPGTLTRPLNENYSYFKSISGYYSRGILHCKRAETKMNMKIFPRGYFKGLSYPVKSLAFFGEVRKGITCGSGRVVVNDKTVCLTNFQDLIEIVTAHSHPIGRDNHITSDRAWFNCLLVVSCIASFLAAFFTSSTVVRSATIGIGCFFFVAQLVEAFFSATMTLLWKSPSWEDFEIFRSWFFELKKFRPAIKFCYNY